jgi:hypothetical protein
LAFADSQSRPLSVQLTVAWNQLPGFHPADWSAIQTRLMKVMSEWLRRRGIEPTFVWVREVSGPADDPWYHTHVQVHVPRPRTGRIAGELVQFLGRAFGFMRFGLKAEFGTFGMWTPAMRAGGLRYWLKGFDHRDFHHLPDGETQNIGAALGIEHRGTQGRVMIKRAGVNQNIGRAARRAAGWVERRDLADLRAILRPPEAPPKAPKASPGLLLGRRNLKPVYLNSRTGKAAHQRAAAMTGLIARAPGGDQDG